MTSTRPPLRGRKLGDRRVVVDRPHSPYFRYLGGGQLTAKRSANAPQTPVGRLWARAKAILVGRPLASEEDIAERLPKTKALAVFSSDAISSSTYASEEICLILVGGGATALAFSLPIAIGIALLLLIVSTSYRQICYAYPSGGGAYAVAKANINTSSALFAAACLLFDYTSTVAVSTAAGVAAITSFVPDLFPYRVPLCLASIVLLTLGNLRGLRESGNIFALPTYAFVVGAVPMIVLGVGRILTGDPAASFPTPAVQPAGTAGFEVLGPVLLIRAFAFGSVALTGTEAISNGVQAFKPPESHNAATTLTVMAVLLGAIFVGVSLLSSAFGLVPKLDGSETLISQVARTVYGTGPAYVAFQVATALILVLAANTGYNGAPRLAQILAIDGYLPRQFSFRGDRLAYSYGIVILALAAMTMIVVFDGLVTSIIPLYSVGIFFSFTLSQSGMVRHWWRVRGSRWQPRLGINLLGASITGVVAVIITAAKFGRGAWIVAIAVPLLTLLMMAIHREYTGQAAELAVHEGVPIPRPHRQQRIVVPVNGINRAVVQSINFGRTLGGDIRAIFVTDDPDEGERLLHRWRRLVPDVPIVIVNSPYRALVGPVVAYLDVLEHSWPEGAEAPTTIVVLPEYVARHWWDQVLYNQQTRRLRKALVGREHTVIANVPYQRGR